MTFDNFIILASVMMIGGLLPSISSLTVLSRTVTSGFTHGLFTSLGIVLGDIIFIIVAIYGLSVLAKTFEGLFELVVFVGGAYLIWLGTMHWQDDRTSLEFEKIEASSLYSSFFAGLLVTLTDQKTILFYLGFFPAIFDLSIITIIDTVTVIIITIVALGGAKLFYVYVGSRSDLFIHNAQAIKLINKAAGGSLILIGSYIMLTT